MISKTRLIGIVAITIVTTIATVAIKNYFNNLYSLPKPIADKSRMQRQSAKGWATVQEAVLLPSPAMIKNRYKMKVKLSVMIKNTWESKVVTKYYLLTEESLTKVVLFLQVPADINPNDLNDVSINWIRKRIIAQETDP